MRLTRYLNVSNDCIDREAINIMDNLEVETLHFEAVYENKRHNLSKIGSIFTLRPGKKPTNYRHLKLGPPSATKKTISFEYPDTDEKIDMIFLGLVYELRVVRLANEGDKLPSVMSAEHRKLADIGVEISIKQKIIGRALYMKCLVGSRGMLYFQITLPEHDILVRSAKDFEMDNVIMKFCDDNFEEIDEETK